MTWHVAQETLTGYVDGTVDAVASSSVEQHLVRCVDCRAEVGRLVGPVAEDPLLSQAWDRVLDRVEAPRPTLVERLLVRLGVAASHGVRNAGAAPTRWCGCSRSGTARPSPVPRSGSCSGWSTATSVPHSGGSARRCGPSSRRPCSTA